MRALGSTKSSLSVTNPIPPRASPPVLPEAQLEHCILMQWLQ